MAGAAPAYPGTGRADQPCPGRDLHRCGLRQNTRRDYLLQAGARGGRARSCRRLYTPRECGSAACEREFAVWPAPCGLSVYGDRPEFWPGRLLCARRGIGPAAVTRTSESEDDPMHEFGVTETIIRRLLRQLERDQVTKVVRITFRRSSAFS